jgi:UDP-N-acetylglucosamine diphosphorylase/glucosamine-1-phosphate N-acetyltransferase
LSERIKIVILAAGKGKRLQTEDSDAPKVMRLACGKPLLEHVINALSFVPKEDIIIVVGYKREQVIEYFGEYTYAYQTEQLGTGHAVMSAADELSGFDGSVLICYGDMPAVRAETYKSFVQEHFKQGNDCTFLTGESSIPLAYGRILRDENGEFITIVEDMDCTPEQLEIKELNPGVYIFRTQVLLKALEQINNNNAQGEYYLTDVPEIMRKMGLKVGIFKKDLDGQILGVNTLEDLKLVEDILVRSATAIDN